MWYPLLKTTMASQKTPFNSKSRDPSILSFFFAQFLYGANWQPVGDTEKPTKPHDFSAKGNDFPWGDVALSLIGVESLDMDEPLMDAGLVPWLEGIKFCGKVLELQKRWTFWLIYSITDHGDWDGWEFSCWNGCLGETFQKRLWCADVFWKHSKSFFFQKRKN